MTDSTTPGGTGGDAARPSDDVTGANEAADTPAADSPAADTPAVDNPTAASEPTDPGPDEPAAGRSPGVESAGPEAAIPPVGEFTDVPTGEVITGPIDPSRLADGPTATAYSQAGKPPTARLDTLGALDTTGELPHVDSSPSVPVVHSAPAKNKGGRRRTIALIATAAVLLLVIAGVGTELYMRSKVTNCIETAFGNLTGANTEVSVSRKPMLLAAFGSDVPWVQVDTNDGEAGKMRLHARAEGISTDGGTVRSLDGSGFLPYDRISALSNDESGGGGPTIKGITADEGAGTIKLSTEVPIAIISVPATVTLKPVLTDGAVKFEVKDATALMFGLPSGFAQPIVDQVTSSMFGPLFKQIRVDEFKVAAGGIDFRFAGQDVNLKAASEGTGESGSNGNCSI